MIEGTSSPVEGTSQAPTKGQPQVEAPKDTGPSKFDVMAQKEKQYVRKMQQVKAMEQKIAQERQQIQDMYKKVEEYENNKKQARLNPDKYLESVGLSYDDLTQYKLNNNNPTYEAKFQSIEEKIEARFREQEEREQKRVEEQKLAEEKAASDALEHYQTEITEFVEANKDKYKFVHAYEGAQLIIDASAEYAKRTNKVMDKEQAAQLAEDYLKEQWLKGKAFMESQQSAEEPGSKSVEKPRVNTLTSSMAPSTASSGLVPAKTDRERMQRALAKLG